ncbi:MAG: hypothetical protein WC749_15700, partial [Dehalococcoidia bacterium]
GTGNRKRSRPRDDGELHLIRRIVSAGLKPAPIVSPPCPQSVTDLSHRRSILGIKAIPVKLKEEK